MNVVKTLLLEKSYIILGQEESRCKYCDKLFETFEEVKNHEFDDHEIYIKPDISCEKCQKSFDSVFELKLHKDSIHPEIVTKILKTIQEDPPMIPALVPGAVTIPLQIATNTNMIQSVF